MTLIPEQVPTLDNTMFEAWERCPRLYQLRHIDHFASKGKKAALSFGGLVHDGLALWYESGDPEKVVDMMAAAPYLEIEGDHRTRGRAITTLAEYMIFYHEEPWERVLLTETPFSITSPDGFRYGGKIDLVVLWKGAPWIVDHKTTSRAGESWWHQWLNSPQMTGYVWGGSELHGAPIKGVIINRILIHKQKKSPEEEFSRKPLLFSPEKVAEWKAMRVDAYNEIGAAMTENRFRPRWDNCINKYGACMFHDVCTVPEVSRAEILASEFEIRPWSWLEEEEEIE